MGNASYRYNAGIVDHSGDLVSLSLVGFLAENQTEFMDFHDGILDSVRALVHCAFDVFGVILRVPRG